MSDSLSTQIQALTSTNLQGDKFDSGSKGFSGDQDFEDDLEGDVQCLQKLKEEAEADEELSALLGSIPGKV